MVIEFVLWGCVAVRQFLSAVVLGLRYDFVNADYLMY